MICSECCTYALRGRGQPVSVEACNGRHDLAEMMRDLREPMDVRRLLRRELRALVAILPIGFPNAINGGGIRGHLVDAHHVGRQHEEYTKAAKGDSPPQITPGLLARCCSKDRYSTSRP